MLLPRAMYSAPPVEHDLRRENNPTLLFSWWTTSFSLLIIIFRLIGRKVRNNVLFPEDKVMFLSTIPLVIRMVLVHFVLIWGTNNTDLATEHLTELQIWHRSLGSRFVLGARIFYALYIWIAKFTISEFLKRLTQNHWKQSYNYTLHFIRYFLVATFIAVVIATLAECQPITHYWQVVPDPGAQCRQGYAQLITMGTADIITDVLLIIFPIPIVLQSSSFPASRKITLTLAFSLSGILIGITAYRVPSVIARHGKQQYRTVFASGEILAAAAVSNVIVLGSFLRDRGVKRHRYAYRTTSSGADSFDRTSSSRRMTLNAWLGAEYGDLVEDMCFRTEEMGPRRAPRPSVSTELKTDLENEAEKRDNPPAADRASEGSSRDTGATLVPDADAVHDAEMDAVPEPHPSATPDTRDAPRKRAVSFCDVGGLLGDPVPEAPVPAHARPSIARRISNVTLGRPAPVPVVAGARRGSRNVLSDIGGLVMGRQHHGRHGEGGSGSGSGAGMEIRDPGGLLGDGDESVSRVGAGTPGGSVFRTASVFAGSARSSTRRLEEGVSPTSGGMGPLGEVHGVGKGDEMV
ncbi:hypothetical protein EJ06DRAFT_554127 [Trichodelitschia bisporula]|uniref:Rhodopsin domain-containing protein n=1 Tax=Trichodelitschia bisporula TaxID=703511 RepID=A0A6G1I6J9_9PEZI|nr:hypothetical protein EJ06DRAFT_554127 [Trichodelitschia bisporula]